MPDPPIKEDPPIPAPVTTERPDTWREVFKAVAMIVALVLGGAAGGLALNNIFNGSDTESSRSLYDDLQGQGQHLPESR